MSTSVGLFYLCVCSLLTLMHLSRGICIMLSAPVAGICLLFTLIAFPKVLSFPISLHAPPPPRSLRMRLVSPSTSYSPSPFPSSASSLSPPPLLCTRVCVCESQGASVIMCQRQSERCMRAYACIHECPRVCMWGFFMHTACA
jgi:hypothetical protein